MENDRPLVVGKGTKQQRGKGVWRYRHNIGKDPATGKYRYSPWRTIHTTKKSEVDAALEAYKVELNSGVFIEKAPDSVGEYAQRFHDNRAGTITPLAYKREQVDVNHIKAILGRVKLQELRSFMIEDAYAKIRRDGTYSDSELHKIHVKLRQVLDCAARDELIAKNPATPIKVPRPPAQERKALSASEAARLRDILVSSKPSAHVTAVLLMLETGVRRGEALGLTWDGVDLRKNAILVKQQFATDKQIRGPKSRSGVRWISIGDTLTSYLKKWKSLQKQEMAKYELGQVKGTPLVHSFQYDGRAKSMDVGFMDPNNFNRWFRQFCVDNGFGHYKGKRVVRYVRRIADGKVVKKAYNESEWAELRELLSLHPEKREEEQIYVYKTETRPFGYEGLHAHMLRHTQATLLIGANADIKTVQARLGHSSINLTLDTYSHAIAANDVKAAAAFDEVLAKASDG